MTENFRKPFGARHRQHGWSLVEMALATAALGLMMAGIWTAVSAVTQQDASAKQDVALGEIEHAVYGYALGKLHFPVPENSVDSPSRAGFIEGWLPAKELGLVTPRRIRYAVDRTLTLAPARIYKADPLGLTGGLVLARSVPNGLDLCLALLDQEKAGAAIPDSTRMAFALQAPATVNAASVEGDGRFWLPARAGEAPPSGQVLSTRTQGYVEAADRLNCYASLAALAASVKATAVMVDLARLAAQDLRFYRLDEKQAREDLVNLIWRIANRAAMFVQAGFNMTNTIIQMETTTTGRLMGAAQIAAASSVLVGSTMVLEIAGRAVPLVQEHIRTATERVAQGEQFAVQLQTHAAQLAAQANLRQNGGLLP